jgi:hypothetical protein
MVFRLQGHLLPKMTVSWPLFVTAFRLKLLARKGEKILIEQWLKDQPNAGCMAQSCPLCGVSRGERHTL